MAQPDYTYSEAKERLEEIVAEVRRKDVSLEKSLDLLEEAGRLASHCTDLIDRADLAEVERAEAAESQGAEAPDESTPDGDAAAPDDNGGVTDGGSEGAE